MTRDEAARAFAEKMGWEFEPAGRGSYFRWRVLTEQCEDRAWRYADLPAPDAPLHEHLAFVGRVAEAIYPRRDGQDLDQQVGWACRALTDSIDPSWSALLAALAALEAR